MDSASGFIVLYGASAEMARRSHRSPMGVFLRLPSVAFVGITVSAGMSGALTPFVAPGVTEVTTNVMEAALILLLSFALKPVLVDEPKKSLMVVTLAGVMDVES